MRKIEELAKEAFYSASNFKSSNTKIEVIDWNHSKVSKYYLHGNLIAELFHATNILKVYDVGWKSNTTKNRLNSILPYSHYIFQKGGNWFIENINVTENWTGSKKIQL